MKRFRLPGFSLNHSAVAQALLLITADVLLLSVHQADYNRRRLCGGKHKQIDALNTGVDAGTIFRQ